MPCSRAEGLSAAAPPAAPPPRLPGRARVMEEITPASQVDNARAAPEQTPEKTRQDPIGHRGEPGVAGVRGAGPEAAGPNRKRAWIQISGSSGQEDTGSSAVAHLTKAPVI